MLASEHRPRTETVAGPDGPEALAGREQRHSAAEHHHQPRVGVPLEKQEAVGLVRLAAHTVLQSFPKLRRHLPEECQRRRHFVQPLPPRVLHGERASEQHTRKSETEQKKKKDSS